MATKKPAPKSAPKLAAKKPDPDSAMLAKYEHHKGMSQKHSAHADLIEARLRTKGKRIQHEYSSHDGPPKRKIVADN